MTTTNHPNETGPILSPTIDPIDAAMDELSRAIDQADRVVSLSKHSARILFAELSMLRYTALQTIAGSRRPVDKCWASGEPMPQGGRNE